MSAGGVVAIIESILERIVDSLQSNEELTIDFATRRSNRNGSSERHLEKVGFPGRSAQEARRFARILLILQLSHDSLVSGTILTKRHIYYQHQDLFETQRQVDDLVDDLAFTLGVNRNGLNIVAASKGVVAGLCTIHLQDGGHLNPAAGDLGTSIPDAKTISRIELNGARWVLVIEKDAIYTSLCSSKYWFNSIAGQGILVTGKGYPDLVTRAFLHHLHADYPQLPILVLADYDPDGVAIVRCYRHGSKRLMHEKNVQTPSIQWLGITSAQILGIANAVSSIQSISCRDPIVQLTLRDRCVATNTLTKVVESGNDEQTVSELQALIMLGVKAEIEWLDDSGNLCAWLDHELQSHFQPFDQ